MTVLILQKLAGLYLLIALGYWFKTKQWIVESAISSLAWIVIEVCMPALFLSLILRNGFSVENKELFYPVAGGILISSLGLLLAWFALSFLSLKNKEKGVFLFLVAVGNSSFLPLPLAAALWGEQGSMACLAYVLSNNAFLFTVGISLLRGNERPNKSDYIRIFTHPQALAFFAGLILVGLKLKMPDFAQDSLSALGNATFPLSMLVTGAILAESGLDFDGKRLFLGLSSLLKLLVLPLLACLALSGIQNRPFLAPFSGILLLEAAMPSLASAGVYARRFGGNAALAAQGSLVSTLLCLLSLPLWIWLWS